eukprot:scaffold214071_cov17-Tisochrysis_lutea.AAC.3
MTHHEICWEPVLPVVCKHDMDRPATVPNLPSSSPPRTKRTRRVQNGSRSSTPNFWPSERPAITDISKGRKPATPPGSPRKRLGCPVANMCASTQRLRGKKLPSLSMQTQNAMELEGLSSKRTPLCKSIKPVSF